MCAGDFLHITFIPLITCCDADPGFPKTRAFTCPRQPQSPQSRLFPACLSPLHIQLSSPTEPVWHLHPWPKLPQEIGICVLGFDLHQKCLVLSLWQAQMDGIPAVVVLSQPWNARAPWERLAGILVLPKISLQTLPVPVVSTAGVWGGVTGAHRCDRGDALSEAWEGILGWNFGICGWILGHGGTRSCC